MSFDIVQSITQLDGIVSHTVRTLDSPASFARRKCALENGLSTVVNATRSFVVTDRTGDTGPSEIRDSMDRIGGAWNVSTISDMVSKMRISIPLMSSRIEQPGLIHHIKATGILDGTVRIMRNGFRTRIITGTRGSAIYAENCHHWNCWIVVQLSSAAISSLY